MNREHQIGICVILLVTVFTSVFSYINEPIGDDVLCYFDGALTCYLDDYSFNMGERFTSLEQVVSSLKFAYLHWTGRMTGYTLEFFGKMLPKYIQAMVTAVIFSTNVFLAIRIVYGKSIEVLSAPVTFILLWLALYWYRDGCYYTYMWTMVSIYSFAVMLALIYYNFYSHSRAKKVRNIFVMQFIGFVAGFSHEIISLYLILMLLVDWIKCCLYDNERWRTIFRHTGLGMGYLMCVSAPGNFHRMLQSHDAITNTYIDRLITSIRAHLGILGGHETQGIFFIVALCAVFVCFKNREYVQRVLFDRLDIIIAATLSIFIWAKGNRVPPYGLDMWVISIYIVLFSVGRKISDYVCINFTKSSICIFILVLLFVCFNGEEVYKYSKTSFERRALVSDAVQRHDEEVIVPRFADDLSSERYFLLYLNDQEQYDSIYYITYYGTRLIIDKEK